MQTSSAEEDPGALWMLAYQAGDEAAFDALVRSYSGRVYALLTRFLGAVPGREDMVQEVFLRVVRARRRYEPSARFSTWLYRIAFNLCVNERERAAHRAALSIDAAPDVEGAAGAMARELADERALEPSETLATGDVVRAVRRAIAALPETQRMALILAKYHELPYAEIGVVLGSSEKAVKSLIHRARETLRERLRPFLQEEPT